MQDDFNHVAIHDAARETRGEGRAPASLKRAAETAHPWAMAHSRESGLPTYFEAIGRSHALKASRV